MRIGIDLGGTKIAAMALDDEGGVRFERRVATPRTYDGTIDAVADIVREADDALRAPGSVGVGTPGAISPATGLVKNANSTWLNGRALDRDLEAALGRPVRLANDANCFALSEAVDGAGAGAAVVFGVILGTGVGGGVVVRGRPLRGANAIAGEWGHNPLPGIDADERAARPCYCGRHGCVETFLCGPALEAEAAAAGLDGRATEIAAAADAGDERALGVLRTYEERLARALASVVNVLDPDVVVLGGGLSRMSRLYEEVPARWGAHVFSDRVDTVLRPAAHGDASGVRGAAWLWE
jgi:fructokinase